MLSQRVWAAGRSGDEFDFHRSCFPNQLSRGRTEDRNRFADGLEAACIELGRCATCQVCSYFIHMSQYLPIAMFCQLTQPPQTIHNPAHEAYGGQPDPRRTTQTTTSITPPRNLPHANKLLHLSPQSNHWLHTIWCVILLRGCISGVPTVGMAPG